MTSERISSLYIHIPFCKKKCNYCDFVSYAGKEELIDEYVEVLCEEINSPPSFPPLFLREGGGFASRWQGGELETIYFGGGTPTLLPPEHFNKIISTIICHWSFDICHSEISVESNPGTADFAELKALRELGINRLSIGVQSFNDKHLQTLGRIHDAQQAIDFYKAAREAGFQNINLDLMFALPSQTLEEWKKDLATALALKPEHLSIYDLHLEEGTPLYLQRTTNNLQLPGEDEEAEMFEHTIETLKTAGYKHYEISNFAKPGFECRHNINYWRNGDYIGVGAGAHSHVNGKRWANPDCVEDYLETATLAPISTSGFSCRFPDSTDDQHETLFLGLRLLDGLPAENFTGFEKEVAELLKDGLLERSNNNYRLTHHGLFLGNLVFEKFV